MATDFTGDLAPLARDKSQYAVNGGPFLHTDFTILSTKAVGWVGGWVYHRKVHERIENIKGKPCPLNINLFSLQKGLRKIPAY